MLYSVRALGRGWRMEEASAGVLCTTNLEGRGGGALLQYGKSEPPLTRPRVPCVIEWPHGARGSRGTRREGL